MRRRRCKRGTRTHKREATLTVSHVAVPGEQEVADALAVVHWRRISSRGLLGGGRRRSAICHHGLRQAFCRHRRGQNRPGDYVAGSRGVEGGRRR